MTMAARGETTGFEWMDTPFLISKVIAAGLGAVGALVFLNAAWTLLKKIGGEDVFYCYLDPLSTSACLAAAVGGVLVWRRPQIGFLILGLVLFCEVPLLWLIGREYAIQDGYEDSVDLTKPILF